MAVEYIESILRYVNAILDDGDWRNDWLTHMPPAVAHTALAFGWGIVHLFGIGG